MNEVKSFDDLGEEEQTDLINKINTDIMSHGYPAHIVVTPVFSALIALAVGLKIPKEKLIESCAETYDLTLKAVEELMRSRLSGEGVDDSKQTV